VAFSYLQTVTDDFLLVKGDSNPRIWDGGHTQLARERKLALVSDALK
jgi:hypothetical protein